MPSSRRPAPSDDSHYYGRLDNTGQIQHRYDALSADHSAPPYEVSSTAPLLGAPSPSRGWNPTPPPINSLAPPQLYPQTGHPVSSPQPRLPLFEAALARSRGDPVYDGHPNHIATQPLPSYVSPPDPNHPDLSVGFSQSNTVRFAMAREASNRNVSRSPSPGVLSPYERPTYALEDDSQRLMPDSHEYGHPTATSQVDWSSQAGDQYWDEKTAYGTALGMDEGDLSLPPFKGPDMSGPAIHIRGPTESTVQDIQGELGSAGMAASSTQHFGPAPSGRVGRREHNAAGHRRIKHTATLDEHGFFAVDMPIPTRLAQFLPFKGVEEQKSTRYVLSSHRCTKLIRQLYSSHH
jgi:chitin synthase